jgi:sterol 3beta-glucosyltransferase
MMVVIGAGWGGLDSSVSGDGVLAVEDVDYLRLFPRVAAVVHHGGAGTAGTAFASERPQVVCPFIADQPFWASLAQQRSVAPVPEPQRHLAAGLASAITTATATTDSDMSRAAQELGHRVSAEDGISAAVTVVERVAA